MRKILIVDDEKIMLMLARRMLSSKYEIVLAKSGAEAVELFEKDCTEFCRKKVLNLYQ